MLVSTHDALLDPSYRPTYCVCNKHPSRQVVEVDDANPNTNPKSDSIVPS